MSRGSLSTSSPTSRVLVPRHVARLVVDYFAYAVRPGASAPRTAHRAARRAARRRLLLLRRASRCLGTSRGSSRGSSSTTSPTPCVRVPRHVAWLVRRLVVDYFDYARTSGCLDTSRGSSHGSSHHSSSTTSPTPCVRVPRHVTRLVSSPTPCVRVARHVAQLVVDYFAYAVRPGASAPRLAHCAARCRLLRLRRASGCLGTLHGPSLTTSPTPCVQVPRHLARLIARLVAPLVVDYFTYAARPGSSARRAARHAAHRRLLRLHRASECLGTSRGLSGGSSSTTLTTPRIRVPRHIARLIVDYFAYAVRPGASAPRTAHRAARCVACRRLLRLRPVSRCLVTSRGS
jgi:hypothetical protein